MVTHNGCHLGVSHMEAKGGILSTKPIPGPMLRTFGMRVQNRTLKKFLVHMHKRVSPGLKLVPD